MLVWLKRFSGNADVEKTRAELERAQKVEEKSHEFVGIGPTSREGAWLVGPLRRQCEDDLIDRYSRMLALVFIPMGRKKFDAIIFA
jgi:hypothetical protein